MTSSPCHARVYFLIFAILHHVQLSGHSLQQWKDAKEVYGTLPFHTDTVVHGASKDEKRQLLKEKSRQRKAQEKQNSSQSKPSSLNPTPEPGSV